MQEGLTWTRISKTRICTQTSMSSPWQLGPGLPSLLPAYSHAAHHHPANVLNIQSFILSLHPHCQLLVPATTCLSPSLREPPDWSPPSCPCPSSVLCSTRQPERWAQWIKSFPGLKAFGGFQWPTSSCSSSHELSHLGTFTNPAPYA